MRAREPLRLNRRELLKLGLMSGAATLIGSRVLRPTLALAVCGVEDEPFPTSPLILSPFTDPLPIPPAYAPSDPSTWRDPRTGLLAPPGPGVGQQDSDGGTHQIWPNLLGLPEPIYYKIDLKVAQHAFTTSLVQGINPDGTSVTVYPDGTPGNVARSLPASTIYGFNGTFPGPRINAEYGHPVLIRFENHLHENPLNLDRQDFGAPDWAFLTHLHNAHTAPESDGNPHYKPTAYQPGEWCDNLYLNWPAGGDAREMQSFFWFHDHRMDHTGANVYKGMVGLYPIYDPVNDSGDETKGYRLPGVRTQDKKGNGTFSVDYDIPLAFYDCRIDDGVTPHQDFHTSDADCGKLHPEWYGKTFFRHYPNHGFVGDIFTVNGVAYPVLQVARRKYRLRFLDASISRIYELKLMSSLEGPVAARDTGRTGVKLQGQWQLPDGQQCMQFLQIASEGGLLPAPIVRDSFQIWPAKRREVVVDFTKYMDGSPTAKGEVVYLVNVLQMSNGRKPDEEFLDRDANGNPLPPNTVPNPDFDPDFRVPVLKFVIGGNAADKSIIPKKLRALPPVPRTPKDPPAEGDTTYGGLPHRFFKLERSGNFGGEIEWLINGLPFDPLNSMANPKQASAEYWTFDTGGGWVHPLHIHMEEHQVIWRNGQLAPDAQHPDDHSKEDVIALDGPVTMYRKFRTFLGKYVCHCHNLAHEDHAMMFGWTIVP